jgi:hypothetical protein
MFQDVRYALKVWARRPWQVGVAIAALAIGIGTNTGVFSVVNALLLRSLPFREPDRLGLKPAPIAGSDAALKAPLFHDGSH